MLLDDKDLFVFASFLPARFGCLRKVTLATVFREFSHCYGIIVRHGAPSALKCLRLGRPRHSGVVTRPGDVAPAIFVIRSVPYGNTFPVVRCSLFSRRLPCVALRPPMNTLP